MSFAIVFALVGSAAQAQAPPVPPGVPEDGVYVAVQNGGVAVNTLNAGELRLGERVNLEMHAVRIDSLSNENSSFFLDLSLREFIGSAALCAGGFCLSLQHMLQFDSQPAAEAFAKYLHIPLNLRVRPEYVLATRFVPAKASFTGEEPVTVNLEIENTGTAPAVFEVDGRHLGLRNNRFSFTAIGPSGDTLPVIKDQSGYFGLMQSGPETVSPGETFRKTVDDLRTWFDFSQPGIYKLNGKYSLNYTPPTWGTPVWEDSARAEFTVTIK